LATAAFGGAADARAATGAFFLAAAAGAALALATGLAFFAAVAFVGASAVAAVVGSATMASPPITAHAAHVLPSLVLPDAIVCLQLCDVER
jgi:hypothetical protein